MGDAKAIDDAIQEAATYAMLKERERIMCHVWEMQALYPNGPTCEAVRNIGHWLDQPGEYVPTKGAVK